MQYRDRLSRSVLLAAVLLNLFSFDPARAARPAAPDEPTGAARYVPAAGYGDVPMAFESNVGQTDERVRYLARGRGYSIFLTASEIVLSLSARSPVSAAKRDAVAAVERESLRLTFVGGRENARVTPERRLAGTVNYLHGRDEGEWRRNVPTYAAVRYEGIYPGVDALCRGTEGNLEYYFEVAPGADPSRIRVRLEGARAMSLAENGDLVLALRNGEVRHQRAFVYQEDGGRKRPVEARYELAGDEVSFVLGDYDAGRKLIVDPTLVFSSYLGTSFALEICRAVALDATGAIYVTGETTASDFPTTTGSVQGASAGHTDAFVVKLTPAGDAIVYATYLGGDSSDGGTDLAVDAAGAVYVVGGTHSATFPTTETAFDRTLALDANGSPSLDAFVAKLSPDGASLLYSTFLGGGSIEYVTGVALDGTRAVVAGSTASAGFPTTPGAFDRSHDGFLDGFVAKLDPDGTALELSTFFGGTQDDLVNDLAVDASGNYYVTGQTESADFPTTPGAFDGTYASGDAFVTKLAADGASLAFSTFLASESEGTGIAVDGSGTACVVGSTFDASFPTTAGAYDRTHNGFIDFFVPKLVVEGSALVSSTYLGSDGDEERPAVALGADGAVHVAGSAFQAPAFPTTEGAYDRDFDGLDEAVIVKLSPSLATLEYSTFLGEEGSELARGIAVDATGAAVVVGDTYSLDFPTVGGLDLPYDDSDAFVTKIAPSGGELVLSTRLGGVTANHTTVDEGHAVAVDAQGAVYITGSVEQPNFPTTPGAPDDEFGNVHFRVEAFVTKLSPDGSSLVYSTYLGGDLDENGASIAVDASGAAYVAGTTTSYDFPRTPGAYATETQGDDLFVVKLSADGSSLLYATDFGGLGPDGCRGLVLDASGAIYLAGETRSADFPTTPGAFDRTYAGNGEGVIVKLVPDGTALAFATYLGGESRELIKDIAVDGAGAVYVTGDTLGHNFPVTPGAFDTTFNGAGPFSGDAFVTKLAPTGASLEYSTFLGGSNDDHGNDLAVDAEGACYVAVATQSTNFPSTPGGLAEPRLGAAVTKVAPDGASLVYSALLGGNGGASGIAVDSSGSAFVAGSAYAGLVTTPGAHQPSVAGQSTDAFLTQLHPSGSSLVYSTYFGGASAEIGTNVALDSSGNAYVVGYLFGASPVPVDHGYSDSTAIFVAKLTPAAVRGSDTVGIAVDATSVWFLKDSNAGGNADYVFGYGPAGAGWVPLAGDWNGDGVDTPGLYDPANSFFFLRNANEPGPADVVFGFGPPGSGWTPVAGDWDGDGQDTVGLYSPDSGFFFLRNELLPGPADVSYSFGPPGSGWTPLAGDWDADGMDTVGLYVPSSSFFFLRNAHAPGPADLGFSFGPPGAGWTPLIGDFDGDGDDTVALYNPATAIFFLRNVHQPGDADLVFGYGAPGATPLVADWDGL